VETKPQKMNYIKQLQEENKEREELIKDLQYKIAELLIYYTSPKFQGFENDFAHVSTDLLPRLVELRNNAYLHLKK
jgi:hypothetical protein